jgi:hypothetical protein
MTHWQRSWFFCGRDDCDSAGRLELRGRVWTEQWLLSLARSSSDAFSLRSVLGSEGGDRDIARISDRAVIERIAELLISARLHVHIERPREKLFTGGAQPPPQRSQPAAPPPVNRPRSISPPPSEPDDPATFPSNVLWEEQAAVLAAAAAAGVPVCYI